MPQLPPDCDLTIHAGRIVCPASDLDAPGAVAVRDGRIVAVGPMPGEVAATHSFPGGVVLPGLIDLHAHPARGGSVFGVDPDRFMLPRGTTTVLSQGDAGAANCADYVAQTMLPSRTRVRLALNLSSIGESTSAGCFERTETIDVDACVAAAERWRDKVWGIAVNVSHHACGRTDPREVMRLGLLAAEAAGLPLLFGPRRPQDWPLDEQFDLLRTGDVVTYCYRSEPYCLFNDGRPRPAVRAARERGVWFDVGHGLGSFDFLVAEAALGEGFPPDTISTDLQAGHAGQQPAHDLPLVMSKLQAAGMQTDDVLAAVTSTPARILRLDHEIGSVAPGMCADLTVLEWHDTDEPLRDVNGVERNGGRWHTVKTIRAGHAADCTG